MAKKTVTKKVETKKEAAAYDIDLNMKISSSYDKNKQVRFVDIELTKDFRDILNSYTVDSMKAKQFKEFVYNNETKTIGPKDSLRPALKTDVAKYIEMGNSFTQGVLYSFFKDKDKLVYKFPVNTLSEARAAINVFAHFIKYIVKLTVDRQIILTTHITASTADAD